MAKFLHCAHQFCFIWVFLAEPIHFVAIFEYFLLRQILLSKHLDTIYEINLYAQIQYFN